ncbi:MAG: threonine synthase, partial [Candidatus Competibacterales bacterium]|nr:threonine synthase [Candidatus Competibacterales bacterium]
MDYLSTRGGMAPQPFSEILIGGLAPDGGLVVPQHYPALSAAERAAWRGHDYRRLAVEVIGRFATDLDPQVLETLIARTYTAERFGSEAITPVRELEPGLYILGLSHGPTLAFKDIAMQLLGELFGHVLAERGETLNILGATSGDTGSSAEYAMRGKSNVKVFMLSPHGRTSPF